MNDVTRAAQLLHAGELVAFPTETVYGLGADARNPTALAKIFAAKGRPADHPLIVHLPDASHLGDWAIDIPAAAHTLAAACWPGPLTLILKRHPSVPNLVTGGQNTIGVRVPNHPVALALLHEFNSGIAAPSANKFGHISPTTAAHVQEELGESGEKNVAMILDGGPCAVGIESTIVDMTSATPRILRPGAIRGCSSVGRARRSQRRGQRFDPAHLHHYSKG
jgi:L-threonylcarbamoyladenylate synthase